MFLLAFIISFISAATRNISAYQSDLAASLGSSGPAPIVERAALKIGPQLKSGAAKLELDVKSAAAYYPKEKQFLYEIEGDTPRPIASITKLMTALTALDHKPDWEATYKISDADRRDGGKIYLYRGDVVRVKDLWAAMLVGSDNTASIALIHTLGLEEDAFVAEMNAKAKSLGLKQTFFKDATGLTADNLSTAKEIAIFARQALIEDRIGSAVALPKINFQTEAGDNKTILSTDALLSAPVGNDFKIVGGKTGYTDVAGYCFVGRFKDSSNRELVAVVLGTATEAERFRQTVKLAAWTYASYDWQ
jgi:D-alanyl-D-alanine carboxypeptidase